MQLSSSFNPHSMMHLLLVSLSLSLTLCWQTLCAYRHVVRCIRFIKTTTCARPLSGKCNKPLRSLPKTYDFRSAEHNFTTPSVRRRTRPHQIVVGAYRTRVARARTLVGVSLQKISKVNSWKTVKTPCVEHFIPIEKLLIFIFLLSCSVS
jgi:hypothetical protein